MPTNQGSLPLTVRLRSATLDGRRGIVRLHQEVIAALGLRPGDAVRLTGRRATAGMVAVAEPHLGRGELHADDLMLGNLGLSDGDSVVVEPLPLAEARTVTLAGPAIAVDSVSSRTLGTALHGKVLTVHDNVSLLPQEVALDGRPDLADIARYGLSTALLYVVAMEPDQALVTSDTVVRWDPLATSGYSQGYDPYQRDDDPPAEIPLPHQDVTATSPVVGVPEPAPGTRLTLEDLAGVRSQAEELRELLDLGLHHREVLDRLGTSVSLGVLVTGPAGSGKATLVRTVAAAVGAEVFPVWAPEVVAAGDADGIGHLQRTFTAAKAAPAGMVLVIDVEALLPRNSEDGARPLTIWFQKLVRGAVADDLPVVGTTGHPEAVDPRLLGPGMLDYEIAVPMPDGAARRDLLGVLTRGVRLDAEVRLDEVAERTPGFVTADLLELVREAGIRAAVRHRQTATLDLAIAAEDFAAALETVRPTSMRGSDLDLGGITLDDVGGMADIKQALVENVLWPLTYPDTFDRLGIEPPRGVLLYGPPGCGKTYLVRAIAATGKANVIAVKGAELLTMWVGESERAVREVFRRARQAAPTLLFLDELDALAPRRGQAADAGTSDRVVAALLTELDGVESLRNVVVVGATNRPELIDPALLRPGRLERLIFVPPPDAESRSAILAALSREMPLGDGVDLTGLGAELNGFSSADCAALVRQAALAAMRESLDAAVVTADHFATARSDVRPSLDPAQIEALRGYADRHAGR